MQLRLYTEETDYKYISMWVTDKRTHAMWCADVIPYSFTQNELKNIFEKNLLEWNDRAYIVTKDNGIPFGFFVLGSNLDTNGGFLKFVLVDHEERGQGYGIEMVKLALKYAYNTLGVDFVQLNVFEQNDRAKNCYIKAGFVERTFTHNAFVFENENWDRCNMITNKKI